MLRDAERSVAEARQARDAADSAAGRAERAASAAKYGDLSGAEALAVDRRELGEVFAVRPWDPLGSVSGERVQRLNDFSALLDVGDGRKRLLEANLPGPVAELDGTGAVVSRFVYATSPTAPDYMVRSGQSYRLVRDQLGSVRLVINTASGAIVQQLAYDEFGQTTQDTNPGFQPFGYAGGLLDPDTGLVHYGAREYDPRTGRFTTKDPIGFAGGDTNHYSYALNDPINRTDPNGLLSLDEAFGRASDAAAGELNALTFGISNEIAGVDGSCAGPGYGIAEGITIAGTIWVPGGGEANATRGARRGADLLAEAAEQSSRGDLTGAGRALAKHGGREGSAFPVPTGSPNEINAQARGAVQDILADQHRRVSFFNRRLGSRVVDIYDRSGRGLRYRDGGEFIGFLEGRP